MTKKEKRQWIRGALLGAGCSHTALAMGIIKDLLEVNRDHGLVETRREALMVISSWRSYTGPMDAAAVMMVLLPTENQRS